VVEWVEWWSGGVGGVVEWWSGWSGGVVEWWSGGQSGRFLFPSPHFLDPMYLSLFHG
jgi:hypothetical protein